MVHVFKQTSKNVLYLLSILLFSCAAICCWSLMRSTGELQPSFLASSKARSPTWSDFGVSYHTYVGKWHGQPYRAQIWLRTACTTQPDIWEADLIIHINSVPQLNWAWHGHQETTPKSMLVNGSLPGVTFVPIQHKRRRLLLGTKASNEGVRVETNYWEELIKSEWKSTVFLGKATLKAGVAYNMHMDGSEFTYAIVKHACSQPSTVLFPPDSVHIGVVESVVSDRNSSVYAFLIAEHIKYHSKLGFDSMVLVVLPNTYQMLLQEPLVVKALKNRKLVLLQWDWPFMQSKILFIQIPSHNLIRMVMRHTGARLAFWDLDEYLVLPSRKSIKHELAPGGCLATLGNPEPDLVIPFGLATAHHYDGPNELHGWIKYGSWPEAVRKMDYQISWLKHCDHGIYCKAFIDVDSNHTMHVHQLLVPPPATDTHKLVDSSCAHMLHFWSMWVGKRQFWDSKNVDPPVPLNLDRLQLD